MAKNYSDCLDNIVFYTEVGKTPKFDVTPATVSRTRMMLCERALSSKNSSLNDFREKFQVQSSVLGNLTISNAHCQQNLTQAGNDLRDQLREIDDLKRKVTGLEALTAAHKRTFDQRSVKMVRVVREMQGHLACLQSEENCITEATHYVTLPISFMESLCTYNLVDGQELYGLHVCPFLGDRLWADLDTDHFMAQNPYTSSVLLLIMVLAAIGGLTILTGAGLLCHRFRQPLARLCRRCLHQPRRPSGAGPEGGSEAAESVSDKVEVGSTEGVLPKKDPLNAAWDQKGLTPEQ